MNEAPMDRILVAVDGSPGSARAVRLAGGLAKVWGSELTLLHVGRLSEHRILLADEEVMAHEEEGRRVLEEGAKEATLLGVAVRTALARGRPAEQILRFASRYRPQLIVMGTRGLTGAKSVLLGSVSRVIAAQATCSVLLAR